MKYLIEILFVCFLIANVTYCAPTTADHEEKVIKYLQSFGYLPRSKTVAEISQKRLQNALRRLQTNGHIEVTGAIDETTLELIKAPRCGVPDIVRGHKRQKRFGLLTSKWEKHHITWHFDSKNGRYFHDSPKIRRATAEALKVWSQNSVLTFEEASEPAAADIVISFEERSHPKVDRYPLDDDAYAHAFKPGEGLGGDAHIRVDMGWDFDVLYAEQPAEGSLSYFAVILHELGHSIGLDHSERTDAVMYFRYSSTTGVLSSDDVQGIEHIYGVPKKHRQPTQSPTRSPSSDFDNEPPEVPDECDTSYDAITLIRNERFIFKGIYMWRPESSSDAIEIRKMFRELPESLTHIDSVIENDDGQVWFFVGRDIYIFSGTEFLHRSSLSHLGIDHHYDKIDAVFKWQYNKRTYIFSGDQYWRLNGKVVDKHYPKDIRRAFRNVYDIDTAFSDNEKLYFFKGKSYFEFDTRTMRIDRMSPQPAAQNFMKCPGQKRTFKIANRFDETPDVIDDGEAPIFPEDEDNIEKLDDENQIDAKTESAKDDAPAHYLLYPVLLASLALSRVQPSILLYF